MLEQRDRDPQQWARMLQLILIDPPLKPDPGKIPNCCSFHVLEVTFEGSVRSY